jgi:SAM-dependent methyltransferase
MKIYKIRSKEEFIKHQFRNMPFIQEHQNFLAKHTPAEKKAFSIPGYSYTAGKQVEFIVDYQHSGNGDRINWRERVCCPETYFNNRMRATFHLFDIEMEPYPDSEIYITEQITPIYTYFKNKYPNTVGSEFLGKRCPFGSEDKNSVRNETLTALSFPDQSFDILVSLDVLEHIPDYMLAFKECARVIRTGGKMMWSVPFVENSHTNMIRAKIEDGEVVHILPPEYHGDPLSSDGVLCFQHFGWEMLEQMLEAGFRDAYALCYHSNEFGYLGGEQFMFVASK